MNNQELLDEIKRLHDENERLHDENKRLSWNNAFGCYTQKGFEETIWPLIREQARWFVFFDVDGVHELNEQTGGYDAFDAMMKHVFSALRGSDYVCGQLKSGDEFLVCLTENGNHNPLDPYGMKDRLIEALKEHGLTATFGIVPVTDESLSAILKPAVDHVYEAKKKRGKKR